MDENKVMYRIKFYVLLYVRSVIRHSIIQVAEIGITTASNGKYCVQVEVLD